MLFQKINWTVHQGKQLGKTIGFPTANVHISTTTELPAATYKVNVLVDEVVRPWIGPWFPARDIFEVHLFDFEGSLYDKKLTIIPLLKIRDNQTFDDLEALHQQIILDIYTCAQHKIKVMTFGTFDHVHPGHESYLRQAKVYGDKLITIVARDSTVEKVKWLLPDRDEHQRLLDVECLSIADAVVLWHKDNYYQVLLDYQPDVICLWYDQHSFDAWIQTFCEQQNIIWPEIVRLEPFHPEQHKSSLLKENNPTHT